jgi:hypothetical protein
MTSFDPEIAAAAKAMPIPDLDESILQVMREPSIDAGTLDARIGTVVEKVNLRPVDPSE